MLAQSSYENRIKVRFNFGLVMGTTNLTAVASYKWWRSQEVCFPEDQHA